MVTVRDCILHRTADWNAGDSSLRCKDFVRTKQASRIYQAPAQVDYAGWCAHLAGSGSLDGRSGFRAVRYAMVAVVARARLDHRTKERLKLASLVFGKFCAEDLVQGWWQGVGAQSK